MRNAKSLLVGAAAAAALGLGVTAMAQANAHTHEMNVTLPDGAVVHVQYTGEKPIVTLSQQPLLSSWLHDSGDGLWAAFGANSLQIPDIGVITANIDRQMAAMRADMARFDRLVGDPRLAASVGSGATGSFCARSVEVTQTGKAAPHVEERSYGACANAAHPPAPHTVARTASGA